MLNLGEGVAAFKPKVKVSKYDITRGEAKECMCASRALVVKGRATEKDIEEIDDCADYLVGALTIMIKNLESGM